MKLKLATTLSLLTLLTMCSVTASNACRYHREGLPSQATLRHTHLPQACTVGCNETHSPAKVQPDTARRFALEGDKKVAAHDFVGAVSDYTRATNANPTFARIFSPATDYFMTNINLPELLADYDQVLQAHPTDPYAFALRGEIKYNLGDINGAEADFRKSLQYKSDLYFAHLRLTELIAFSESESLSTADFDKAVLLFPHSARMHHNMGLALDHLGFTQIAVAEYSEASKLSPEWSRPYYMMAFADLEKGDNDAALADLNKCVKYEPTWSWAHVLRARQESKAGDYEAAIKDLDQAIALEPDSKWLGVCRARLKLSSGDTLGGLGDFIGIASKRSEFHILFAMWFILAQLKFVSLGRDAIRRRLIINE